MHITTDQLCPRLLGAIEFMITAFISVSWKPMVAWETYTKSLSALKDLTAWRMKRTLDNWQNVAPQYRPTRLQMSVEHPSVIDWIPVGLRELPSSAFSRI